MNTTSDKKAEMCKTVKLSASELNMIMKYSLLHERKYKEIYKNITAVWVAVTHLTVLKVIIEISQLSEDEIVTATVLTVTVDADYVKTSMRFLSQDATVQNVKLMHAAVDMTEKRCKIKTADSIRSVKDCVKILKTEAAQIRASSGVRIVKKLEEQMSTEQERTDTY